MLRFVLGSVRSLRSETAWFRAYGRLWRFVARARPFARIAPGRRLPSRDTAGLAALPPAPTPPSSHGLSPALRSRTCATTVPARASKAAAATHCSIGQLSHCPPPRLYLCPSSSSSLAAVQLDGLDGGRLFRAVGMRLIRGRLQFPRFRESRCRIFGRCVPLQFSGNHLGSADIAFGLTRRTTPSLGPLDFRCPGLSSR